MKPELSTNGKIGVDFYFVTCSSFNHFINSTGHYYHYDWWWFIIVSNHHAVIQWSRLQNCKDFNFKLIEWSIEDVDGIFSGMHGLWIEKGLVMKSYANDICHFNVSIALVVEMKNMALIRILELFEWIGVFFLHFLNQLAIARSFICSKWKSLSITSFKQINPSIFFEWITAFPIIDRTK